MYLKCNVFLEYIKNTYNSITTTKEDKPLNKKWAMI